MQNALRFVPVPELQGVTVDVDPVQVSWVPFDGGDKP